MSWLVCDVRHCADKLPCETWCGKFTFIALTQSYSCCGWTPARYRQTSNELMPKLRSCRAWYVVSPKHAAAAIMSVFARDSMHKFYAGHHKGAAHGVDRLPGAGFSYPVQYRHCFPHCLSFSSL